MVRWVFSSVSGLALAVIAVVLFWMIDQSDVVNGVGQLRRRDWPINSPWVWAAAGYLLGALAGLSRRRKDDEHSHRVQDLAERTSRRYEAAYSLPQLARSMPLFAAWSSGCNALFHRADELPMEMFDFTTTGQDDDSDGSREMTVALTPVEGLPAFDLRPRTLLTKFLDWLRLHGVTFDTREASPRDARIVSQFTKLFRLSTWESHKLLLAYYANRCAGLDAEVDPVRRLFTPAVMEALSPYRRYRVQAGDGFLVVWRGSGVLNADQRSELWEAAQALRTLFDAARDRAAEPIMHGLPGTGATWQARRLRNSVIGALAGLVLGMFLHLIVTISTTIGNQRWRWPIIDYVLLLLLFLGVVGGGGLLGAAIGSRCPLRELRARPPEPLERRRARARAAVIGSSLGIVVGFFGGFAAFSIARIRFGWRPDHFGVQATVFFTSIFGGAALGAVLGGMTMYLFAKWLQRRNRD